MVWDLAHVITKLELGGAQLATLYEVQHSRWPQGRRFLFHGPGGMLNERAREMEGVTCVEIPALVRTIDPERDATAVWQLARALRRLRRPGAELLVHTHTSKAGILGRWAARFAGADRVVHSIHGFAHNPWIPAWRRRAFLGAELGASHVTDGFTSDSAGDLERARCDGILNDQAARVVRCAIDVGAYEAPTRPPAEVRRELGVPSDADVVINVSCLKPQKDPEAFVRVAAEVLARRPDAYFWLAGDGERRESVQRLVGSLGVGERMRLLGWRDDVGDLLHAADLLVLTSRWEGLPQTFPQAMAAGRPIVATDVNGAAEAVTHGDNGSLYPVGDVAGMATGVVELLADPERRARMGEAGHGRVHEFSVEKMLDDLDGLYQEVAMRPPRARPRAIDLWRQARTWVGGS